MEKYVGLIYIYIWVHGLTPWLSLGKLGGLGE
jgi:hypothetical protein